MKFIHSGDIHLGAVPDRGKPWSKEREREIWATFERLIEETDRQGAQLLVIAGDLFHKQPLKKELKEVNSLFASLKETKVVLCAGNHDCLRASSNYRDFEWNENVIFIDSPDVSRISIDELNTDIYGLSYYTQEIREAKYDDAVPQDPSRINILIAHGGDEKHIPMNRRKLFAAGFDYIAGGHIHIPEVDLEHRFAYCGTLEPIDINDTGVRGFIEGTVTKGGLDLEFVPFSTRIYKHLEVSVKPEVTNSMLKNHIRSCIGEYGPDNIYKFTIEGYRDPDITFDPDVLSEYGNVARIIDNTVPDYDFEKLERENKNNMIGMYIRKFEPLSAQSDVMKKALYYGTKALLDASGDR